MFDWRMCLLLIRLTTKPDFHFPTGGRVIPTDDDHGIRHRQPRSSGKRSGAASLKRTMTGMVRSG
jgi:hypothetical protein